MYDFAGGDPVNSFDSDGRCPSTPNLNPFNLGPFSFLPSPFNSDPSNWGNNPADPNPVVPNSNGLLSRIENWFNSNPVISLSIGGEFTAGWNLVSSDPGFLHGESNFGVSVNWQNILSNPLNSVVFSYNSVAVATPQGGGLVIDAGLGVSGGFNGSLPNTVVQNVLANSPTIGDWETITHSQVDLGAVDVGSFDSTQGSFSYGRGIYDSLGVAVGGMAKQTGNSVTTSVSLADIYNAVAINYGLPLVLPPPRH